MQCRFVIAETSKDSAKSPRTSQTAPFLYRIKRPPFTSPRNGDWIYGASHSLGGLYADQSKHAEAEEMYQLALAGFEKAWGPKSYIYSQHCRQLGYSSRCPRQACGGGEDVSTGAGWKKESTESRPYINPQNCQ